MQKVTAQLVSCLVCDVPTDGVFYSFCRGSRALPMLSFFTYVVHAVSENHFKFVSWAVIPNGNNIDRYVFQVMKLMGVWGQEQWVRGGFPVEPIATK